MPGVPSFPFRWELVDAYYYLPRFGNVRPPEELREAIAAAEPGDVLVFHPFLADPGERLDLIREVLIALRHGGIGPAHDSHDRSFGDF